MIAVLVLALVASGAFFAWCFYDAGYDSGYTRAWNEAHPRVEESPE